ncbi:hypothetical protein Daus18300_012331 [Diaporthe australafricana]|uniref:HNH nuclease domain-containing protein n=1 Tax=Diaporthe australafricana TaxID=127596 RepID=A0ABR3W3A4_9PEZI
MASRRRSSWRELVVEMEIIDEVIQIEDRYGEPQFFEELDADDRWIAHVAEHHERLRATARAAAALLRKVGTSGSSRSVWWVQYPHPSNDRDLTDPNSAINGNVVEARDSSRIESRDVERADSSSFPDGIGTHLPGRQNGPQARNDPSAEAGPSTSHDTEDGNSGMTDGNKEIDEEPRSFFDTSDSDNAVNDSSDDNDEETEAIEAERERKLKLFEDVPTCIRKARHLPAISSDDHGIMAISNPEMGWEHIDPAQLPTRIHKYLAEFTLLDATAFPDGACPDVKLNSDSHRWLLATPQKEFICDTSTVDVWFRYIGPTPQARKRQLIQNSRQFQERQGPRVRCNPRAGANHRLSSGHRALPRCNWEFWGEPDDTNRGPQIIVTEPSGASHYLIDPDTFRLKVRQRRERRPIQAATFTGNGGLSGSMEDMASCFIEEIEADGEDELDSCPLHRPDHTMRWWLRLGRTVLRPVVQPRALLPLYHNHSISEDPEKAKLLGYDGAQDEKPCEGRAEMVRSPGVVDTLRNMVCSCLKL